MQMDPQVVAENWAQRLSGASEKIRRGVEGVTESPTRKAAQQVDRYVQGVNRAVASGKYKASLERVSLDDWKEATLNKGIQRISQGALEAQGKVAAFMADFLPFVQRGREKLERMPRGTLDENIARAVAMMRHNASYRRGR